MKVPRVALRAPLVWMQGVVRERYTRVCAPRENDADGPTWRVIRFARSAPLSPHGTPWSTKAAAFMPFMVKTSPLLSVLVP